MKAKTSSQNINWNAIRLSWMLMMLVLMMLVPTHLLTTVLSSFYENGTEIAMTLEYESDSEEKEKEKEKSKEKATDVFVQHINLSDTNPENQIKSRNEHSGLLSSMILEIATPPPRL